VQYNRFLNFIHSEFIPLFKTW